MDFLSSGESRFGWAFPVRAPKRNAQRAQVFRAQSANLICAPKKLIGQSQK
jgi:hypothetical protein